MKKNVLAVLFSVILISIAQVATAETISYKGLKKIAKKINVDATFMASSNSYNPESTDYSASSITELAMSTQLRNGGIFLGSVSYSKDLTGYYESELASLDIVYSSRKYKVTNDVRYRASVVGSKPLDEYSRDDLTLNGALGLTNNFSGNLKRIGLKNVLVSYTLGLSKNFNTYKVAYNGSSNTSYSFRNRVGVSYVGFGSFGITYGISSYQSYTYSNYRNSPSYSHGLTGSYGVKNYSASFKVSTGGSVYRPDGKTNNVTFFESDKATYLVALGGSI